MTLEVQGTAPERTSTAHYLQKRSQSYGASSLFNRTLPTLLHQDIFNFELLFIIICKLPRFGKQGLHFILVDAGKIQPIQLGANVSDFAQMLIILIHHTRQSHQFRQTQL
ncbi:hypothetical protein P4H71_03570 [Paenibacillus kribbensis]|uniref:hypothetical protein n=1 Tax=Paenibacillus kribbensis TaxID=172713 RepID=UPI0026A6E77C|nr:hypothetical protein [Paenibacillus kribbensis]MEC0233431.1 hypothetical protein [Paenibacillus kribbensis]